MMQAQYRNISGTESLWVSHTVGSAPMGVQWAQINVTGGTISPTPVQQQIWTQPEQRRCLEMDAQPRRGSPGRHGHRLQRVLEQRLPVGPVCRTAGRRSGEHAGARRGDDVRRDGIASVQLRRRACHRWGDYTAMSVDPVDDCTFWYVGEYYVTTTSTDWQTRIGSFKFPGCTAASGSADLSRSRTPTRPIRSLRTPPSRTRST